MYQVSFEAFMSKPFSGQGMGHFEKAFLSQQIIDNPTQSNGIHQYQHGHPHNELLLWLVEQGLLAGVAFILLIIGMLYLMWRGQMDYKIALLTLPLVLHSLTEYPFYQSILHYALLLIFLSLASSTDKGFTLTIRPLHLTYLVPINALVFILPMMFSVGSYQANKALVRFYQSNATNAEVLLVQNHTLGFTRLYNFELLTWALNARKEQSRQQRRKQQRILRFYAEKVAQDFASKPNPELGYRLIDAQLSLGQMKTALHSLDEFRRYFPHAAKDPSELFEAKGFNVDFEGLIKKRP
jgi:O-antigen polymerase